MDTKNAQIIDSNQTVTSKAKDFVALMKIRLATLVVFSAFLSYLIADKNFEILNFLYLIIGGFLVTGSSNAFNQIIESHHDAKMERTKDRPMPAGRLSQTEAIIFSVVIGVLGLIMLWLINPICFFLGLFALFSYVALYTPLKRVSALSVFVGAFPGSIPPMLGYIAATSEFGAAPGALFAIQFVWQFPHFWAIAWKLNEDYSRAGFKMLPFGNKTNKATATVILASTAMSIPAAFLPYYFGIVGEFSLIAGIILGIWMTQKAFVLFKTSSTEAATKLMFTSFGYLPLILFAYLIDVLIWM